MRTLVAACLVLIAMSLLLRPLGGASSRSWPVRVPTILEGQGWTNVLLLGLDRRGVEPARSDVILLIRVGPVGSATAALSIPRDLWIPIPGRGEDRINTAYTWGDIRDGDGLSLARRTVEDNFGVRIDRVTAVDFKCFEAAIDAIGGVDVQVPERLADESYPGDDGGGRTVVFEPGRQRLSGERALQYVRTRSAQTDFARMRRQQQVLAGFVERARDPTAALRALQALPAACPGFATDLSPVDLLAMGTVAASGRGLETHMINESMVSPATMPSGAEVLLPHWERIRPAVGEVFAQTGG